MVEANCDVEFAGERRVTIVFPPGWEDALLVLKQGLDKKRLTQVYAKIGKPRTPRSTGELSQNHHLNGHVQQIAAETGDSFDDVKLHVKREAISMGYPYHTTTWGDVVPQSEADASTEECGYLIETAHRIASFLDIRLREV
jgi:hypothetical protein